MYPSHQAVADRTVIPSSEFSPSYVETVRSHDINLRHAQKRQEEKEKSVLNYSITKRDEFLIETKKANARQTISEMTRQDVSHD